MAFVPKRIGFKAEPPRLVLDYVIASTGHLHRRSMPVHGLSQTSKFVRALNLLIHTAALDSLSASFL
jgi:hypothetical protein